MLIYNEPDVLTSLNRDAPLTAAQMSAQMAIWPKEVAQGIKQSFVIQIEPTGEIIGLVELDPIKAKVATAALTIFIGRAHRRQLFAQEALQAVLDWGIDVVHLSRIDGVVMRGNTASMALLRAVGMTDRGEMPGETRSHEPLVARLFTYSGKRRSKA